MPLLLALLLWLAPARHAYHASITEMRYNAARKQLELSIKVFTDDFEKALSKGQPAHVSLATPGPLPTALASAYLKRTFEVKTLTGKPLPLAFLGLQAEKDAYWIYAKVPLPGPQAGILLRNAVLLDHLPRPGQRGECGGWEQKAQCPFRSGYEQEEVKW